MNNLLHFLVKASSWLLFIAYMVVSSYLLFTTNPFQHHLFLTSAGRMASGVYKTAGIVTAYFSLKEINDDLQRRNAELESQLLQLQSCISQYKLREYADTMIVDPSLSRYHFILAKVINNSVARPANYITIDHGALDGITPEMGVVDQNGIVGIVNVTGPHTARVISVLNPYLRISAKVRGSDLSGSLHWEGHSPREALLEGLPRHAPFSPGDTVVTTGFSSAFPEGVPVGVVLSAKREHDDNFFALKVKLFTDFSTLSTVRVISDSLSRELQSVEKEITVTRTMQPI